MTDEQALGHIGIPQVERYGKAPDECGAGRHQHARPPPSEEEREQESGLLDHLARHYRGQNGDDRVDGHGARQRRAGAEGVRK